VWDGAEHLALPHVLQVSVRGDAVLLLNPLAAAPDGEAWDFAAWHRGALRYPSFWALVQAKCERFRCKEP
jgi:hypothetical protein